MTYRIKHTRKRLLILKEKNLLMTIDTFFLLVRSNQDSEQENLILAEFCQATYGDAFPPDFGDQAASLRLDIQRAVNDASMASIFESIIWFDQQVSPQISLLDTMFTDMRGA